MKVALLAPEFAKSDGGIQRILRLYLSALAEDPAHTSLALVALNDRPADLAQVARLINGKPVAVEGCSGSKAVYLRAAWRAGARAGRVVCGHVAQLPVAALAARSGAQLALVAHGIEVWPPLHGMRRLALQRAHRVFCVSQFTRDRMAANHPSLASRLRIVPNALDFALFDAPSPQPPPPDMPPVVLSVGRLCAADAYKGYDMLLRAFAGLAVPAGNPRPVLRFVGTGDDLPRLKELAANLGLGPRVEFAGRLSDDELRRAFAECTCFALPSTGEGFGLVYLEALAAGRPCVGVRAAAVPELVTPEVGRLAVPGDIESLTAALAETLAGNWNPSSIRATALRYDPPALAAALRRAWN